MKTTTIVAVLIVLGMAISSSEAAGAGSLGAFCKYYSTALNVSNNALVTKVVNDTVFGKIFGGPLQMYFDGTRAGPLAGFDYRKNSTALTALFGRLVEFFGLVLNCTDGTIAQYGGLGMAVAHNGLVIPYADFALFNQYVLDVLAANKVDPADIALVAGALNGLNSAICQAKDCQNICNKYSVQGVVNNSALMTLVVSQTVMAAFGSNVLLPFFNGQITYPGVTDYTKNVTAITILGTRLATYFGNNLGCTDGTVPGYAGTSLTASHSILPINNAAFTTFNGALVSVLANAGVSTADQTAVATFLESTRSQVCFQPDCAGAVATSATGAKPNDASGLVPAIGLMAIAAAALL